MATFSYDQFSVTPTAQAVIKRLGMGGFGRLIRIVEECTDNGQLALSWSDWLSTLECSRDQFDELLATLVELEAFSASQGEGVSAPLMLTLGAPLRFLLARPDPATVVFTKAAQWSEWMTVELAAPLWLTNDPASQELFRRWCASNVSLAEIQQAAERAALAHDVSLSAYMSNGKGSALSGSHSPTTAPNGARFYPARPGHCKGLSMILIGLFGGSPESREEITLNLIRAAGSELAAFNNPPTVYEGRTPRVDALNIVLRGAGAKVQGPGLVVTHVASLAEAEAIRSRGGHLWHVMGQPCDFVPIRAEDLPVTAMAGGCRHYLDALEAYSETLLRHGRVR